MDKSISLCMAGAAALVAYLLITLAGTLPIAGYMWVGFLPMILYFCTGAEKDLKLCSKMFVSYLCGLAWGQLSNLLWVYMFPQQTFALGLFENGIMIFIMLLIHVVIGGRTLIGFMPCVYLGLCETVVFWGRPSPFAGVGLLGTMPIWQGLGVLVFYFIFGMAFALGVQYLTGFFVKLFLRKA